MPPKFQSSFIPKGPLTAPTGIVPTRIKKQSSFLGLIATLIFIAALVSSVGVFGYNWFLKYRISHMSSDLEGARASIDPEAIRELARLDARLLSTHQLIEEHTVLTPLFSYLENSTPTNVRFTSFGFENGENGLNLLMRGQARSYAALALLAQLFNKGEYVVDPIFSELNLDDKGNVTFAVKAGVGRELLSYSRDFKDSRVVPVAAPVPVATSSATTTSANTAGSTSSPQTKPR